VIPLQEELAQIIPWRESFLPNNFHGLLDNSHRHVRSIINKACYIVFGHFGQLLLEDTFETGQNDGAVTFSIVVNNSEFNDAFTLLSDCRLSYMLIDEEWVGELGYALSLRNGLHALQRVRLVAFASLRAWLDYSYQMLLMPCV
jgi:hypothetical protein